MKKIVMTLMVGILVLSLAGCQKNEYEDREKNSDREEERSEKFVRIDGDEEDSDSDDDDGGVKEFDSDAFFGDESGEEDSDSDDGASEEDSFDAGEERQDESAEENGDATGAFDYALLDSWNFSFSSGAGGWGTGMTINADGSFKGSYMDSDMGDTGSDYPNGTVYMCRFYGKFTPAEKVNEYTYSMRIADMQYEDTPGEVEIKNGARYLYQDEPYGLDDAEEFYIYTPDAPVDELPEEYLSWVRYSVSEGSDTLGFYGIYNVNPQYGFSGYKQ